MSLSPNINEVLTGMADQDYYRVFNVGPNPPPVFNEPIGERTLRIDRRNTVSSVTPGFERLPYKLLPHNPYKFQRLNVELPKMPVYIEATDIYGVVYYTIRENITAGTIDTGLARLTATADDPTQKVISKLIAAIGTAKADLGTTMAEMGKTAAHVAKTATRIANFLISLKKGKLGEACASIGITATKRQQKIYNRRYAKAKHEDGQNKVRFDKLIVNRSESRVTDLVADTWLEYSYGWKPLLNDVYNLAEATAQSIVERQNVLRYQTAKSKNEKQTVIIDETVGLSCRTSFNSKISVAIGVNFSIDSSNNLLFLHAFGLSNPLTIAWELIPFSFVADWFLPVGDAIRSLTAYNGLGFHSGWKTTKTVWEWQGELKMKSFSSGGGSQIRRGTITGSYKEFTLVRENLIDFPGFGFPKWKDPRSFSHAASAVSLLQSLFLRK